MSIYLFFFESSFSSVNILSIIANKGQSLKVKEFIDIDIVLFKQI